MKHQIYVGFSIAVFSITLTHSCYKDPSILCIENQTTIDQQSLNTALIQCIKNPQIAMLEILLQKGANADSIDPETGIPAIMLAVTNHNVEKENDHIEIPKLLIHYKADTSVTDKKGRTLNDYLEEHKASPRLKALLGDTSLLTPLVLPKHQPISTNPAVPTLQRFTSAPSSSSKKDINTVQNFLQSSHGKSLSMVRPIINALKSSQSLPYLPTPQI